MHARGYDLQRPTSCQFKVAGEPLVGKSRSLSGGRGALLPSRPASGRPSVDWDGVFAKLQELEELVPGPLLQSRECTGFLIPVLVGVKDDLRPLLGFLVAGVSEELLERLLVQALENVSHGFLPRGRVKAVAVDRRAHPQGGRHAGEEWVAGRLSHQCLLGASLCRQSLAQSSG